LNINLVWASIAGIELRIILISGTRSHSRHMMKYFRGFNFGGWGMVLRLISATTSRPTEEKVNKLLINDGRL